MRQKDVRLLILIVPKKGSGHQGLSRCEAVLASQPLILFGILDSNPSQGRPGANRSTAARLAVWTCGPPGCPLEAARVRVVPFFGKIVPKSTILQVAGKSS
jgi:hypothetical protein